MLKSDILESVQETRYLSADNYTQYRAIMRIFFEAHQKMHYQLDKETILSKLRETVIFENYSMDQLKIDLNQLVLWQNLTPIQDPHKVYTVADYKNKQFQYMMSEAAVEIERMTIILENLCTKTAGVSSSSFRRIRDALEQAERLPQMELREIGAWWQDLQEDFRRLNQNHQDYLREFYGPTAEKNMKTAAFIAHKQQLLQYLREFIRDLQRSSAQIGAQLESIDSKQTEQILQLVYQSELQIPRPQMEQDSAWKQQLRLQEEGIWHSLNAWFVGEHSTANQVLDVTNEIIRRVVSNASLLVQMQNMGVSRKAEYQSFLKLFAQCGDLNAAHCLSAQLFGVATAQHYTANAQRTTDSIFSSVYEEPPLVYQRKPRIRAYKPRLDRTGFADHRAAQAESRARILQEQQRLRQVTERYIRENRLDFTDLREPLEPEIRQTLLAWVVNANLNESHTGRTEFGRAYHLRRKSNACCVVHCTDGDLTMPDYVLDFEAEEG